jgi:hypothetical protein
MREERVDCIPKNQQFSFKNMSSTVQRRKRRVEPGKPEKTKPTSNGAHHRIETEDAADQALIDSRREEPSEEMESVFKRLGL